MRTLKEAQALSAITGHPFKRGDTVDIFQNPLEMIKSEGRAVLNLCLVPACVADVDGLEYWEVSFIDDADTSTYERWVNIRQERN